MIIFFSKLKFTIIIIKRNHDKIKINIINKYSSFVFLLKFAKMINSQERNRPQNCINSISSYFQKISKIVCPTMNNSFKNEM